MPICYWGTSLEQKHLKMSRGYNLFQNGQNKEH